MSETNGPRSIPRGKVWRLRYLAYRHKYGRFKAFWRGIVLAEMYMLSRSVPKDDVELMEHLIQVELVSVEWHLGDRPPSEQGNGRSS